MFFLPFVGSSICDSLVIYLYSTLSRFKNGSHGDESNLAIGDKFTTTLFSLALARILLVCGPLTYHTVTGRRLKWPAAYYTLYICSAMFILAHMVTLVIINSNNTPQLNTPLSFNSVLDSIKDKREMDTPISDRRLVVLTYIHRVWAMLIFSLWSIALHIVIVWHVRSTGPETVVMDESRRDARKIKRMTAYASISKLRSMNGDNLYLQNTKTDSRNNCNFLSVNCVDDTAHSDDDDNISLLVDQVNYEGSTLLVQHGNKEGIMNPSGSLQIENNVGEIRNLQTVKSTNSFDAEDFFSDIQARMKKAQLQWSGKLNELQKQMLQDNSPNVLSSTNNFFLSMQLSPFRVLLQLFAYEEVLANGRLDACFELDNGEGLTFYVPQLLSFLLHGAYLNAPELETWILTKCKQNVHFAHRCFWFLRAWCLGHGSHQNPGKSGPTQDLNDYTNETTLATMGNRLRPKRLYGSETNLYKYPSTFSSSSAFFDQSEVEIDDYENLKSRGGSSLNDDSHTLGANQAKNGSKFPIEEHRLIEALLFRVIDCGEICSEILQFGNSKELSEVASDNVVINYPANITIESPVGTFLASATDKGLIPVDPSNGFPSVRHLNSFTAKRKYGFMPLYDETSFHGNGSGNYFLSTPRFLDALTTIADDLMLVQREKRTKELRKRLKSVEVELLPSNVVYLPMKNVHHRVWRIVAEESIALSTKERVPCIVCLEVVDYNIPSTSINKDAANQNKNDNVRRIQKRKESDILEDWYKRDRHPNRHNTLFNKVTQYTHKSLKMWRDDSEFKNSNNNHSNTMISESNKSLLTNDTVCLSSDLENQKETIQNETDNEINSGLSNTSKKSSLLPPLPPSTKAATQISTGARTLDSSYGSSYENSPLNSRASSPTTSIGQWSSPTFERDFSNTQAKNPRRRRKREKRSDFTLDNNSHASSGSLISDFDSEENSVNKKIFGFEKDSTSNTFNDGVIYDSKEPISSKKRSRPPPVVFKEDWSDKESRFRSRSAYGNHPGWRLLPVLLKSNDDLRQEQLASQLIQRMSVILAKGKVDVWLCPYEIIALNDRGGIIEAIPDTISLDSLKRNYPNFTSLYDFFTDYFGSPGSESHDGARANFVESMAAYSMVCFIMQIKDRHNGNILLDSKGHIVHIDFGFFFLSSPGKNSGFESAPFKLTSDFVALMDGPFSRTFAQFRYLCYRTFLELRKHCYEITILVEMLMEGNEDLSCFRQRPKDAVRELRERFRLDLSDRACLEYVNSLIDESLENWRTTWYDRYQRYCVGVL